MAEEKKIAFNLQRFARDPEDTMYRGRRRWSVKWEKNN